MSEAHLPSLSTQNLLMGGALVLLFVCACTDGNAANSSAEATSGANSTRSGDSGATHQTSGPQTSAGTTGMTDTMSTGLSETSNSSTAPTATTAMTTGFTSTSGDTGVEPPPLGDDACQGYATRYWDCCKAHCGWEGNVHPQTSALASCDKNDVSLGGDLLAPSACDQPAPNSAYTCYNMTPWKVSETLSYGFAAVPAMGDICGRCFQLDFDGSGHYKGQDPGSVALLGKRMIVQATNIGFDVSGGQFDILTPGGGVGAFDACSYQWGVDVSELGATYGGFMTYCQEQVGEDHTMLKECVLGRCAAVFVGPELAELAAGCEWYVDWYEVADNPNLRYQEVNCPGPLVAKTGIDRSSLDDIALCMGGGLCSQEEMDACDCSWTNGGTQCGIDDGSCCWTACCV